MKIKVFWAVIGALLVALALLILLTPVSTEFTDPCGSVLMPAKTQYMDGGELVFANTPPCHDARMSRIPIGVIIGVAGLAAAVFSLVPGRRRNCPRLCPGLHR